MARSSPLKEPFLCCICLDVFADPVTTPCGHNYCKTCITHHWDSSDVCKCPLCQKRFNTRPELSVNRVLSEVVGQLKEKQAKKKKLKTTASRKQEPAKPNEGKLSRTLIITFNLLLLIILCYLFTKSDQTVSLKEDYERMKAEMRKTDSELQQMIQERQLKIQEFKDSVELSKRHADREIADSVQVFTALVSFMQRSQAEFVGVIEEDHTFTEKQAEGFIEELQQEMAELKKRSSELKQLLHTEDPLHLLLLNNLPIKDWTKVHVHHVHQPSYEETVRKTLRKEMESNRLRTIQQYAVDITLDPDTNRHEKKDLPDNTEGFSSLNIVLGKPSFSSGRSYYEVQVKGKTDWDLGVATEFINRMGRVTLRPNISYWAIKMRNGTKYYAAADPDVLLPVRGELQTVGVFVDYEEGVVSFYDVEARVHLHSFTGCTFTDELYPYFSQYIESKYDAIDLILFSIAISLLIYFYW